MSNVAVKVLAVVSLFLPLGLAGAQTQCLIPTHATTCSYTAVNGDCTVTINRFHPISTPTIYMRRGSKIKVNVLNPTPFEDLSLDLKSATAQPPVDQFATGFTNLTGALAGFAGGQPLQPPPPPPAAPLNGGISALLFNPPPPSLQSVLKAQKELGDAMKALPGDEPAAAALRAYKAIHKVEQPLPTYACDENPPREDLSPWIDTARWKAKVLADLETAIQPLSVVTEVKGGPDPDYLARLKKIQKDIDDIIEKLNAKGYDIVTKNQKQLTDAESALEQYQEELAALTKAVEKIPLPPSQLQRLITDPQPTDRGYDVEVWTLNYLNKLAPVAKRLSTDKFANDSTAALHGPGDQPAKQTIATISVQFQPEVRFELSTGFWCR